MLAKIPMTNNIVTKYIVVEVPSTRETCHCETQLSEQWYRDLLQSFTIQQ